MINLLLATAGQCGLKGPTTATQFTYEDLGNNVMKITTPADACNKKYILYPRAESPPVYRLHSVHVVPASAV